MAGLWIKRADDDLPRWHVERHGVYQSVPWEGMTRNERVEYHCAELTDMIDGMPESEDLSHSADVWSVWASLGEEFGFKVPTE
jgi:hypothetical protein